MNKKYLAFGVIGLFALALVTGALVNYLSNSVTADVEVESPLTMKIGETSGVWSEDNSLSLGSIYGGESIQFVIETKNLATVDIFGKTVTTVTNPSGVTCNDFESITLTEDGNVVNLDLGNNCETVNWETIQVYYSPKEGMTFPVNYNSEVTVDATFKDSALGIYTLTGKVVPSA